MDLFEIMTASSDAAKAYIKNLLRKKQDKLTFDTTPTEGSTNPVTSSGVKAYIDQAIASIVNADNKAY